MQLFCIIHVHVHCLIQYGHGTITIVWVIYNINAWILELAKGVRIIEVRLQYVSRPSPTLQQANFKSITRSP